MPDHRCYARANRSMTGIKRVYIYEKKRVGLRYAAWVRRIAYYGRTVFHKMGFRADPACYDY